MSPCELVIQESCGRFSSLAWCKIPLGVDICSVAPEMLQRNLFWIFGSMNPLARR